MTKESQTTPTSAECLVWLENWLAQYCQIVPPDNEAFVMQSVIRKQLKEAQEMARVLAMIASTHSPWACAAKDRLTAWNKVGGL